jgi:hypothetical protein
LITERELDEAIAEIQGKRDPCAPDCLKLSAYLTIKRELFGGKAQTNMSLSSYSFTPPKTEYIVHYESGTEFSKVINGRRADEVWKAIDHLMSVILAFNPRLYTETLEDIQK